MPQVSPRGTYLLIAEMLRKDIELGVTSRTLPSEASLMRTYDVSRNTIRRALKTLEAEAVISPVAGVGWQVSGTSAPPLIDRMTDVLAADSLLVGDTFPSESALCDRFDVSRTAVRRALALMEGAGLLSTVRGKGRVVRALPDRLQQP